MLGRRRPLAPPPAHVRTTLPAVALLVACTQPVAVAKYARAADRTTQAFSGVAGEMTASCVRFERYKAERDGGGWDDDAALRRRCAGRDSAVKNAVVASLVLREYFAALANLAANQLVHYDADVRALAQDVGDAGVDPARARAVGDLAAFLADAATGQYRRRELAQVVETENESVLAVVDGLHAIVTEDYRLELEIERQAVNDYFHTAVATDGAREPLAAMLVKNLRDDQIATIATKESALRSYARALARVRAGHQALYDAREELDAPALANELAGYVTTIDDILAALRQAF
ncbi:MAG TPA: hypothetical protein VEI06_02780 [Gemmatimonadaceae bacterium]|nr:hypothetical protein [Gemmatimonadaceae bacterium]